MIVPTTLPRFSGEASVAARGTRICATTENSPVSAVPIIIIVNDWLLAVINIPPAASSVMETISIRRSNISPNGTRNSSPAA
ncbi:Uncharacterised protein [Enterobacter cloacae]|nr:Uncharacterised protein [Enterobacter cloacae]